MKKWEDRLKTCVKKNKPGHIAYAKKQIAMWKMFIKEKEHEFKGMLME